MDYKLVPAFFPCVCPVRGYLVNSILAEDHPITLAAVTTMEILSKWQIHFGIPLSNITFDDNQDADTLLMKHSNTLEQAIAQTPTLSHGYDLLMNMTHNNANKSSTKTTRSVFRVNMVRCHWPDCGKTRQLQACFGCHVAFYCCPEHQKDDGKQHNTFCKTVPAARTKSED